MTTRLGVVVMNRWLARRRQVAAMVLGGLLAVTACSDGQGEPSGFSVAALESSINEHFVVRAIDQVRAVVILQHGKTLLADYRGSTPRTTWDIESVTKSILSILVGKAIDEGRLSLDQTLAELLPEHVGMMARWQQRLTLRDLLTHFGGFSGDDGATFGLMSEPDVVDLMLSRARRPASGQFLYSNEGSQIIATILRRATGMSVLEYARTRLFDPLSIDTRPALDRPVSSQVSAADLEEYLGAGFAWPVDSAGTHLGWGLVKLTPADLAKVGTLMLNGGTWEGSQILSEAWVRESTGNQVSTDSSSSVAIWPAYGYHWWVTTAGDEAAFLAWGFGGQMIEVVPAEGLVVVVARELDYRNLATTGVDPRALTDLVDEVIVPALP
jgi:CubicO group peptidase (beta-lactamase class C family)